MPPELALSIGAESPTIKQESGGGARSPLPPPPTHDRRRRRSPSSEDDERRHDGGSAATRRRRETRRRQRLRQQPPPPATAADWYRSLDAAAYRAATRAARYTMRHRCDALVDDMCGQQLRDALADAVRRSRYEWTSRAVRCAADIKVPTTTHLWIDAVDAPAMHEMMMAAIVERLHQRGYQARWKTCAHASHGDSQHHHTTKFKHLKISWE